MSKNGRISQHKMLHLIFAHSSLKSRFPLSFFTVCVLGSTPGGSTMEDEDDKRFRRRDRRGAPLRLSVLSANMVLLESEDTFVIGASICHGTKVSNVLQYMTRYQI